MRGRKGGDGKGWEREGRRDVKEMDGTRVKDKNKGKGRDGSETEGQEGKGSDWDGSETEKEGT